MKTWKVIILPDAEAELDGIYSYISKVLMEPVTAGKLIVRMKKEIGSLKKMPERFRLYENEPWRSRGLRIMPVGNFVVMYHTASETATVFIDSVLYGKRDIDRALEEKSL